jgi:hypothetical protein
MNNFQLNKKYGEWAEKTIYKYFKTNIGKTGLNIFYFGSQVDTIKKDKSDAKSRPDFILLKTNKVKKLEKKYKIYFNKPNLNKLVKIANISIDDRNILNTRIEYWMTKVSNKEVLLRDIMNNSFCMLEIKSGFRMFDKTKYEQNKLNIIIPIDFNKQINNLNKIVDRNITTYVIYMLLDKAYIANIKRIQGGQGKTTEYSYERMGKSDVKKRLFRTLTFKHSYCFADIRGAISKKKNKVKVLAKPYIEVLNGAIKLNLNIKPSYLRNVNIDVIKKLKY